MGKRSTFTRMKNDFYPTPMEAVYPLIPHLQSNTSFIEPCVGEGHLVRHLGLWNHHCVGSFDLPNDVTTTQYNCTGAECFITNPPWSRDILHPAIDNLRRQLPTWLLFDADWMHTKQAREHLLFCDKIVSVGRVKWIEGSKSTGKDNAAWYQFVPVRTKTTFYGRL